MQQTAFHGEVMILSGREVFVIPCLAVIGGASVIGAVGYGVYKLSQKLIVKVVDQNKKES